jgi:hypothetical protein
MRRPCRCLFLVGVLLSALAPCGASAEETPAPEGGWFTAAPRPYPGLLGRRYVSANTVWLSHGDEFLELFDDDFTGYGVSLNHPVLQPDATTWVGIDAFVSWGTMGLGGSHRFAIPAAGVQFEADSSTTSLGATFYGDFLQPVRPLAQIGARFSRHRSLLLVNGFGGTAVDCENSLLLAVGLELDLNEWLAARTVFDLETEDSLEESAFKGDLIAWPSDRVFVRGGLMAPLTGDSIGGHIGAGVSF